MCGIAGIYYSNNKNHTEMDADIKKMTSSLTHREPDDHGFYVDDKIALGHRRLNIMEDLFLHRR